MDEGMKLSVELIPVWVIILAVGYGIKVFLSKKITKS